jgi:broad specificity phosphatase PhoE
LSQHWPAKLWIVRHGESAGNVARDAAHAAGRADIELEARDVDVPLSHLGERQSRALGRWFASMPPEQRPDIVLTSPYLRARTTATIVQQCSGLAAGFSGFVVDERLREKEFGILDRLTRLGIEQRHPEQAASRRLVGKFYFRPPAGESWCDVILRLRSMLDTISLHYGGKRVLVVAIRSSCFACVMCSKIWTRKPSLRSMRRVTWRIALSPNMPSFRETIATALSC